MSEGQEERVRSEKKLAELSKDHQD